MFFKYQRRCQILHSMRSSERIETLPIFAWITAELHKITGIDSSLKWLIIIIFIVVSIGIFGGVHYLYKDKNAL